MSNTVEIEHTDGSGAAYTCEDGDQVRDLLEEFKDCPVRVWVDGDMVQQGFICADDIPLPLGL